MKPIFYTDETFGDFQIGSAKTDKSMYDVLIKILAEGWTPYDIVSIKYSNGYLIVKTKEFTTFKKGQRIKVKSDEITNEFMIMDSFEDILILYNSEYTSTKDSSEKSIQGTIEALSAGWTQEYRDENNVVLKPNISGRSDRLVIRQNAFEQGIYVMDKDTTTSMSGVFYNMTNLISQPIALFNYDSSLSLQQNIVKYSIKAVETHDYLPNHTTGTYLTTLSCWVNKAHPSMNAHKWWVYATDEIVMYGIWCWFNIFKISSVAIYGVVDNTYGTRSTILTGLATKNNQGTSTTYNITTGYYSPFYSGGIDDNIIDVIVTRMTLPESNEQCTVYGKSYDMFNYSVNTQNVFNTDTRYCPYIVKDIIMSTYSKLLSVFPFLKIPIKSMSGNIPLPTIGPQNTHNIIEIDGELYYILTLGSINAWGGAFANMTHLKACIKL